MTANDLTILDRALGRCADCGVAGYNVDTATGEIVGGDGRVVACAPAGATLLLASEHGDHEAVCDGCERRRDGVTDEQVRALGREAAQAGDTAQRILCDLATIGYDCLDDGECDHLDASCPHDAEGYIDYSGGGHTAEELREIRRAQRMSQSAARAECERVIRDAEARATEDV